MRLLKLFSWLPLCLLASAAVADEVRYIEKDGVTYQETVRKVRRQITETTLEPREQTIYRDKVSTDFHPTERRYMVPITEYQWQPEWVNPWNPFSAPYVTYRWMPVTRWVERTEQVRIPVTKRETVPEKITTHVPVNTPRFAEDEYITRIAIPKPPRKLPGPAGGNSLESGGEESVARKETVGGVRRYESDPPRSSSDSSEWRSVTEPVRRY